MTCEEVLFKQDLVKDVKLSFEQLIAFQVGVSHLIGFALKSGSHLPKKIVLFTSLKAL